ncbi:MAG: hypothetical protein QXG98_03775 [Candidatus Micrarchaeia archaeon]
MARRRRTVARTSRKKIAPAGQPVARAEIKIVGGIPSAPEPFPRSFLDDLKAELESFWRRLELIFKAGEPPRRLPPEKILE